MFALWMWWLFSTLYWFSWANVAQRVSGCTLCVCVWGKGRVRARQQRLVVEGSGGAVCVCWLTARQLAVAKQYCVAASHSHPGYLSCSRPRWGQASTGRSMSARMAWYTGRGRPMMVCVNAAVLVLEVGEVLAGSGCSPQEP